MAHGIIVLWDHGSMPSRALTFLGKIRDASHQPAACLLVVRVMSKNSNGISGNAERRAE